MTQPTKPVLRVTAEDLDNFDQGVQEIGAGNYVIIVTKPAYVANVQQFGNGTVQLTLKGVTKDMSFADTPIVRGGEQR
ncbi:MAG TPA: hypothetical protein VK659_30010 [Asanoa sp.]|nr:hypothetical protein [Asanoa sp.]